MKLGKKFLALLLVGASFTAQAGNDSGEKGASTSVVSVKQQGNVAYVRYAETPVKAVKVNIKDSEGRVIFQEKINATNSFVRPYNLNELAAGAYTVEVIADEITTSELTVKYEAAAPVAGVYVSTKAVANNQLAVVVNNVKAASVLYVYNQNGDVVYTQTVTDNFAKKLIFSELTSVEGFTCKVFRK